MNKGLKGIPSKILPGNTMQRMWAETIYKGQQKGLCPLLVKSLSQP